MMFTEALAEKIVAGEKTVTRRRLSDNPRSPWYRNHPAGKRYPVGKVFTVNPGRGVRRVAECEVTARYRQTLLAVGPRDARAEGFDDLLAFQEAWRKINGGLDVREVVDVVEFKLVGGPHGNGPCNCADCLLAATCA